MQNLSPPNLPSDGDWQGAWLHIVDEEKQEEVARIQVPGHRRPLP
jgi:hypothetical protein